MRWLLPIQYLFWLAGRLIFSLRYRVTVHGVEQVAQHPGPYLFLPNHPGYADPPILVLQLWIRYRVRPVLLETNFQNPFLWMFPILLNAIRMPDTRKQSQEVRQRAEQALESAAKALQSGESVLMWPSGTLTRDGSERIGAARGASDILQASPDVTVVLVRTRGVFGSRFSWADGKKPQLIRGLLRGLVDLLYNGLFFIPRRRVTITMEAFPPDRRPAAQRETLNPWLTAWYNADTPAEPPTFVPYHFAFGPRTHEFPPPSQHHTGDVEAIPESVKATVNQFLAEKLKRPLTAEETRAETTLQSLGIDSLDTMELNLEVERTFGFTAQELPTTIGSLWLLAAGQAEIADKPTHGPPPRWFRPPSGSLQAEIFGDTIPEAVLNRVLKNRKDTAVADDLAGVLSYERLFLAATLLADRFTNIPEKNVGLMLPASVAGISSLLGLHLAGKLPVLLNWTTGPAAMSHGVNLLDVKTIITSKRFIDRTQIHVPGAEFFFLEDLRKNVTTFEKLRRLIGVKLRLKQQIQQRLAAITHDPDAPACVLFTSGSEKAPKAVPLSHKNVLSDLRAALPLLELDRNQSGLIFLPLFHSFGHTVTGILPLATGVKVVYHPDPTDAAGLVRKCAAYRTTALAATPTFWSYMLEKAKPGELDTLEIVVLGAEKCPAALFDKTAQKAPNAVVMEGYGITECAPVVSVNPRAAPKRGTIGKPLVGFQVMIRDLETDEPLPPGRLGMLHLAGPNVFSGYLSSDQPAPFRECDGQRWYITGDLAELDHEGYLLFHGRLKRFLKAGGEMISLPALEEPFARKFPPGPEGPRVAVEGIERASGGRLIVLFTTEDISIAEANALLIAEGHRGVMRLDEVRKVPAIPILGTGKTDYKVLRANLLNQELVQAPQ